METGAAAEPSLAAAPPVPERNALREFREWMARYLAAGPEQRQILATEGLSKARERRTELARLIVENPRAALENAVPMTERQELPPAILALLEERVSTKGFYGVLGVVGAPATQPAIRRELRVAGGKRYEAFVYGKRLQQPTTDDAVVYGIAVGNALALHPNRVRALEVGEIPDLSKPVFETCPVSGKSTAVARRNGILPPITEETPAVEIGGEIHYVCDGGHIHAVEEQIVAREGVSGGR
jgi:hypothetical protein